MLRFNLRSKLVCRVDRRIDVPPQSFLSWLYRCDDIAEGCFADHQQIDVAGGVKLTPGSGAEHEGRVHTIRERDERLMQNVHESRGLREQTLQLGKDGCLLVRLKVHLLAANLAAHQAGSRQQFELALNRADRAADVPDEFPQVVRFVRVTQEPSQDAPPRATEQDGCRVESRRSCSQDGDNRIQNGNARSTVNVWLAFNCCAW